VHLGSSCHNCFRIKSARCSKQVGSSCE